MANPVEEKWDEILGFIKNEYNLRNVSFDTWISKLIVSKVENNTVYITSSNKSLVSQNFEFIEGRYGLFIKTAIIEVTGIEYEIEFETEGAPKTVKKTELGTHPLNNQGLPLNPDYTFENFVVSKNNQLAHATALKAAESPGDIYNPLYIYGESGLGKTHLMQSIGHFILETDPNKKVMYVTGETFTNELVSSIRQGNLDPASVREKYRNTDVLLIDDIQFIIGKERTQEEFFYTFNTLYEAKKQIVITSDKPPRDLKDLDERWRSRFGWGLIVDLTSPDYETKIAILQKKLDIKNSEGTGADIPYDVLAYMADNINSNIRTLEGALTKVITYSRFQHIPVTRELAEYALRDILTPNQKKVITPEFIMEVVAEHYRLSIEELLSKKRDKGVVIPRQIAVYLSKKYTDYNQAEISKVFNKDHSTIISSIKNIEEKLKTDKDIEENIKVLTNKINPDR